MKNNNRLLLILKYLTEYTDEEHYASIAHINGYLKEYELDGNREIISDYKNLGFDIKDYPNAYTHFVNEISLPLHICLTDEQVEYVIEQYTEVAMPVQ